MLSLIVLRIHQLHIIRGGKEMKGYLKEFQFQVNKSVEDLLHRAIPTLSQDDFALFEKNGNRSIYENVYFEKRKMLAVFGMVLLWDESPIYVRKLEEIICSICEETTWAVPAHVRSQEENYRNTIDLFAAETGQALSLILCSYSHLLSEEIKSMICSHVDTRLIEGYLALDNSSIRWERFHNNWIAVCAGCLGSIAINLYSEDITKQRQIIDRVIKVLPRYLTSFGNDGSCLEGLAYYNYGLSYYFGFARQMYEYSNGEVDLLHSELMGEIAHFQNICYLNDGVTVSFSDGNQKEEFRMGMTCYMTQEYSLDEAPDISYAADIHYDHCYRYWSMYQDYVWTKEYLESNTTIGENHTGM